MNEHMTKDELKDLLKEVAQTSGSIKVSHPSLGNTFPNSVPFTVIKNQQSNYFLFLFEPHNPRTLTNAIEPTLTLLLKLLHQQKLVVLTEGLTQNLEVHRSLRVFQEDSDGRIDEVVFQLTFSGGQLYGEITHKNGERQLVGSNVNVQVSNLRWRALTKNLFKNMKIFDLKN